MPQSIGTLVYDATQRGDFATIASNTLAQFGTPARRYIGAELIPERLVTENAYTETGVSYRTVIANSGSRYSSSQRKGGAIVGTMDVRLGSSDIKSVLDGREFDALLQILARNASMEAIASITNFVDVTVNRALVELLELQRWQAIVNASVVRKGDNGLTETIVYPTLTGFRVAAGSTWSTNTNDPLADIFAMVRRMAARGRKVRRIITGTSEMFILLGNSIVLAKMGYTVVNVSGQVQGAAGFADPAGLNAYLGRWGLPPIETYDLMYRTSTGSGRFLPAGTMVFICETGRDESLDMGDGQFLPVPETVGYMAIGRAAGQSGPGRVVRSEHKEDKPPRLVAEGWQEALPVLTEPDAVGAITGIA